MKVFILTYNENIEEALRLEKELLENGFPNPIIINNLPRCDKIHIKPYKIIFYQFLFYILPQMNCDTIFFEDDTTIGASFEKFRQEMNKGLISRLGYNKIPNQYPKPPNFIQGSHCVGFKKEVIEKFKNYMWKNISKPVHFDKFLCNFYRSELRNEEYYIPKINNELCGYTKHFSLISGNKVKKALELP